MEKGEFKWLILTILVLGFCFSFRDWGVRQFDINIGLGNLILTTILVAFSVAVHEIAHRKTAKKYEAEIQFKTWGILLLAALIITALTNGYFIFTAVWALLITPKRLSRPKHKYPYVGPWERAKIAATGPVSNFILALIAAIFVIGTNSYFWTKLMTINFWMAAMNLFPFFRTIMIPVIGSKVTGYYLPKTGKAMRQMVRSAYMEGEVVFFGSSALGIFLLTLTTVTAVIIMYFKMFLAGIAIGVIASVAMYIFMQYYFEPWNKYPYKSGRKFPSFRKK